MSLSDWAPVATFAAGIVTGGVTLWAARDHRVRDGRWEALKTDLEIAALLDDDDPMRKWIYSYAQVRLRAFAAAETRPRHSRGSVLVAAIFAMAFACLGGYMIVLGLHDEMFVWTFGGKTYWIRGNDKSSLVVMGVLTLLLGAVSGSVWLRRSPIRGVRGPGVSRAEAEIGSLHRKLLDKGQ